MLPYWPDMINLLGVYNAQHWARSQQVGGLICLDA